MGAVLAQAPIGDGQHDQGQQSGCHEAADHDDRERTLDLRPGSGREEQRNETERRNRCGHQDRAQATDRALQDGSADRLTGGDQLVEVRDEDKSVQNRNA